jgi:hypothetical protein
MSTMFDNIQLCLGRFKKRLTKSLLKRQSIKKYNFQIAVLIFNYTSNDILNFTILLKGDSSQKLDCFELTRGVTKEINENIGLMI